MSESEVTSTVPFSFAKRGSKTNGRIGVRSATLEKECSATGATAACCDAVDSLPPAVWDPLHYKGDHATIRFLFHLVQVREFS